MISISLFSIFAVFFLSITLFVLPPQVFASFGGGNATSDNPEDNSQPSPGEDNSQPSPGEDNSQPQTNSINLILDDLTLQPGQLTPIAYLRSLGYLNFHIVVKSPSADIAIIGAEGNNNIYTHAVIIPLEKITEESYTADFKLPTNGISPFTMNNEELNNLDQVLLFNNGSEVIKFNSKSIGILSMS